MTPIALTLAVLAGALGLAGVCLNFYAAAQAERRHLRSYVPKPHWQAEAAIDMVIGVVLAVAAVVLIAALLRLPPS
jgi:uncharacterized membrane protein YidH (DUF202 family)